MKAWLEVLAGLALVAVWLGVSVAADRATGTDGTAQVEPAAQVVALRSVGGPR